MSNRERVRQMARAHTSKRIDYPEGIEPGQTWSVVIGGHTVQGLVKWFDPEVLVLEVKGTWGPGTLTTTWEVCSGWQRVN